VARFDTAVDRRKAIQAWLGHKSITSTTIYTAPASNRFKDFWRD
jgi:site-specific recombinase XerD